MERIDFDEKRKKNLKSHNRESSRTPAIVYKCSRKRMIKSVHIWQSYCKNKSYIFLWMSGVYIDGGPSIMFVQTDEISDVGTQSVVNRGI